MPGYSESLSTNDTVRTSSDNLVVQSAAVQGEDEQQKFFNFQQSRQFLERLVNDWIEEIQDTELRRKQRKLEIDVEALRQKNDLDEDETFVPQRVIDTNITREQPPYINYIKNSRRIAIMRCLSDPEQNSDNIEQDFTRVSTYESWELPIYRCLDGSQAHGTDACEVVYDARKPGSFAIEQIGHDKLFYPQSAIDIQECPRIIRAYDVTILQLQAWISKYGFSEEQLELIRASRRATRKEAETIRIYRLFFKQFKQDTKSFCVYVSWFCLTDGCADWLKAPQPHYVGIDEQKPDMMGQTSWQPKEVDLYPIFILPYKLSEEQPIIMAKGRGFLDEYKQEAQTALWSAYINGMNRACNLYACPDQEDGTGASLKEMENLKIPAGRFMNRPIRWFSPPYPDAQVLRTLQFWDTSNAQETNQVNFAAMNREDSRKTAKEISAAENQQTMLNSVQLTLFSTFIRQLYSFAWLITQSQALQNKIQFLLIQQQQPQINPVTQQPIIDPQTQQPMMQTFWTNDVATIGKIYEIRAAGDVDVIQRQEIEQKMQQDFQLISTTPLATTFMLDYIKLRYPDKGERYAQVIQQQGDQMTQLKGLVGRLSTILEGALKDNPQFNTELSQQQQQDLAQTIQEAKAVTGEQQTQQQQ